VLLAVARAAGETAPLLFVIGSAFRTNRSLFNGTNTTLSVQIFKNASQPFAASQQRAWAAALTLIGIVFVFTVLARSVVAFYSRRSTAT
jgi:phosphate transport system permease protein